MPVQSPQPLSTVHEYIACYHCLHFAGLLSLPAEVSSRLRGSGLHDSSLLGSSLIGSSMDQCMVGRLLTQPRRQMPAVAWVGGLA